VIVAGGEITKIITRFWREINLSTGLEEGGEDYKTAGEAGIL